MRTESRHGFTLIETMVALTVGSAVVFMVHAAFGTTMELSARLDVERARHRAGIVARQRLTLAFGSIDIGTSHGTGFDGGPHSAAFTTRLAPAGAPRSEAATNQVRMRVAQGWLVLNLEGQPAESLIAADDLAFDYLLTMGAESGWVQSWRSPVSAPLAVRLRLFHDSMARADTLFFLIGPRG